MPIPADTPTAAELASLSEIVMLSDDETLEMVSSPEDQDIADAKWALTVTDLSNWTAIRDDAGDVKKVGAIEFFDKAGNTRLNFRNNIRRRYGWDVLLDEAGNTIEPGSTSPGRSTTKTICFGW